MLRRHPTTFGIFGAFLLAAMLVAAVTLAAETPSAPTTTSITATTVEATTTTATEPPAPTPTVAVPRTSSPAPRTSPPQPAPDTTAPVPVDDVGPCEEALVGVRAVGLPAGFAFYCSAAKTQGHAGLTYYDSGGGSFIAISPSTGNHAGVGAHEACHAQQFVTQGSSSEADADACAAAHGHPNPYAGTDDVIVARPADAVLRWLETALLLAVLVLTVAVITLLPAIRRRLRSNHHRKEHR